MSSRAPPEHPSPPALSLQVRLSVFTQSCEGFLWGIVTDRWKAMQRVRFLDKCSCTPKILMACLCIYSPVLQTKHYFVQSNQKPRSPQVLFISSLADLFQLLKAVFFCCIFVFGKYDSVSGAHFFIMYKLCVGKQLCEHPHMVTCSSLLQVLFVEIYRYA